MNDQKLSKIWPTCFRSGMIRMQDETTDPAPATAVRDHAQRQVDRRHITQTDSEHADILRMFARLQR